MEMGCRWTLVHSTRLALGGNVARMVSAYRPYYLIALLLMMLVICSGCGAQEEDIAGRFERCAERVADRDLQVESLECFTPKSQVLLRGLMRESKASRLDGLISYQKLLAYNEIMNAPEVDAAIALLRVRRGKQVYTVIMRRHTETGEWQIDVTELPGFWQKLHRAATEG